MRSILLAASLLFSAAVARSDTPDHLRGIVRAATQKFQASTAKRNAWLYILHSERREYDASGKPRSEESFTLRRDAEGEFVVSRLLERNGKPVSEDERRRIEERIQAHLAELRALPTEERRRRAQEAGRKQSDEDAWIAEFPEALDYRQVGEEVINGRQALVLECSPRPGYRPTNMRARVFEKTRGRMWVDKNENELVKADVEVFDTVNIGFGLFGRIEKGTRFRLERQKLADGVWLPTMQSVRFAARILLVKSMNREFTTRYSDFRPRPSEMQKAAR
ncbi:MAG TPA: hypothetical protein VFL57_14855 [Bryobacteraceae bacterium]|nr:hypothetical protein [Bryobacteraceae bacterium]